MWWVEVTATNVISKTEMTNINQTLAGIKQEACLWFGWNFFKMHDDFIQRKRSSKFFKLC